VTAGQDNLAAGGALRRRNGAPAGPVSGSRDRLGGLDGLRGLAVLLVLAEHFTFNAWVRDWSPGMVGVRVFFVLSGFLITGVLLDLRERHRPGPAARLFFSRRARRLLPALILAVTLALAFDLAEMRRHWPWHLSSLSNVLIWVEARWIGAGHFWTLAVEQQFYLLWGPVVLLVPRRALFWGAVALFLIGPLWRLAIVAGGSPFLDVLLPGQADALGAGALMALARRDGPGRGLLRRIGHPLVTLGLVALLLALAGLPAMGVARPPLIGWVILPAVVVLSAVALIETAIRAGRGSLLTAPWLRGIGTVSYGLYIYHYLVPQFVAAYLPALAEADTPGEKALRLAVWLLLSFGLAVASWVLVERPILTARRAKGRD